MEFILSTAIGYRLLMCILQEYITLCFVHSSVAKRSELQLHIYLPTGTLSLACGHVFSFDSLCRQMLKRRREITNLLMRVTSDS